jgi:hypothetical protein
MTTKPREKDPTRGKRVGSKVVPKIVHTSKREEALSLLFEQPGVTVEDVKFFVGVSVQSATEEDVWGQIHSALLQERMGTATVTTNFKDLAVLVDAKAFLSGL